MSATHDYAGIAAIEGIKTFHDKPVRSYEEALAAEFEILTFRTRGPRTSAGYYDYLLGSNVYLRSVFLTRENYRAVVLYDTEIVRYYPDDTFSVDNCGYNTLTTSARVNQFTPDGARFWHDGGILMLVHPERFGVEPTYHHRHGVPMLRCDHSVRISVEQVS